MEYHFKIHKEGNGYWAECLELKGCQSQANSKAQLLKNLEEALNLYLREDEIDIEIPLPKKSVKGRGIVAVSVQAPVAFAVQLRHIRRKRKITQKEMMALLGIHTLSNYQRLEDPARANPELRTLALVCQRLPEFEISRVIL